MKIVGLITEYYPFHNGHLYHIQKQKRYQGGCGSRCYERQLRAAGRSGHYAQASESGGSPPESRRAVVMELPVCYASGSAEYFAAGAISLFEQMGCIDSICFGSECGDYKVLERIARVTADEPEEYKFSLQGGVKKGHLLSTGKTDGLKGLFKG